MKYLIILFLSLVALGGFAQKQTYCNPVDIDYTYMSHYAYRGVSYRSGADPAVINYKGKYYMFVTRSHGYWYSDDMSDWKFVRPQSWYFNGSNAPAAAVYKDEVIVLGDPSGRGAVIKTDDPIKGDWKTTYSVIPLGIQDPNLFVDEDDRVYLYEESSNKWPIRGVELDAENWFLPKTEEKDLFKLHPEVHGWERFGQNHESDMKPFIEGPWMSRHGDTYYLEYSAPGTQWNVYADGVYTAKSPLGPFEYAPYNPISYKPGGFLTGAGHGSTVRDNHGQYWHYASMTISVNYKFERRIGMFPAGFEEDGQMYVNTAYGDYPHFLPDTEVDDHKERFTGWMLLSKDKPITTNSVLTGVKQNVVDETDSGYMLDQEKPDYTAGRANDENMRTLWVAENNSDSLYLQVDLGEVMDVKAVQINFMDFNAYVLGKPDTLRQQFVIETSKDGKTWQTSVDFSDNQQDRPHAYIELPEAVKARYVRYQNVYFPNQYLAIAEFRVFGNGNGKAPKTPAAFVAARQSDERNADLSWKPVKDAMGYVVYWGIAPDRLNNSVMIYDQSEYALRALNKGVDYYLQVEAFNENGISKKSKLLTCEASK
ncbi:family 43 glycosylhydrolase [Marinoscillum furvescens]|uniref:F5/8 type C domain-containing protein n=1 Tax=Marinoscillum furvescens DSM 4134 TaxID=1122208 RepID=A0A3D9L0Y0_MARFU|nr:family 43 glycosylhydrolase [Marinoscillum furvescens]RED96181.1 F5/8 type C domain-containing protein [Marinoscillum furvescens DSM 4134]